MKNKVIYTTLDNRRNIIERERVFPDQASACTFFNEIKHISYSKPIIETLYGKDINDKPSK
jgi:hypothetical protein